MSNHMQAVVERLRMHGIHDCQVAADEIERLQTELSQLTDLREAAVAWVQTMKDAAANPEDQTWKETFESWQREQAAGCKLYRAAEKLITGEAGEG